MRRSPAVHRWFTELGGAELGAVKDVASRRVPRALETLSVVLSLSGAFSATFWATLSQPPVSSAAALGRASHRLSWPPFRGQGFRQYRRVR